MSEVIIVHLAYASGDTVNLEQGGGDGGGRGKRRKEACKTSFDALLANALAVSLVASIE